MKRTKLFVESIPLVEERPSGVGHSLAGLVSAMLQNKEFCERYEIILLAPRRNLHKLDRWHGLSVARRKGILVRARIMNGLMKFHLLPPMDWIWGRGVYLFGNFKNWPVSKRSYSLTYIHDIAYALYPEFVAPKNQRMLFAKAPGFIKQTDYVVTVSDSSRKEIIEFYKLPEDKVVRIYNGVETTHFYPHQAKEIAAAKKKYGITGEYFFFISNIEPRKNIERLVEAFSCMPREYSLVLVGGNGWLNEDILKAIDAARADGVSVIHPETFVPDEDAGALASGSVALVVPSLHEGFGIPAVEGMASGVPVVLADIPSLREVGGGAAVYVDPLDSASILKGLKKVVSLSGHERTSRVKEGIIRSRRFSWESAADELFTFLKGLKKR